MNRNSLELPPLRERLSDAWPFVGAFVALIVAPFLAFPLRDVLMGWLIGSALYLVIRVLARKPLYDYISSGSEFGLDAQGRVHVLRNEREAFTPIKDWDPKKETRQDVMKGALWLLFLILVSTAMVVAAELWKESIAVSAFCGGMIVLSVAEPLQQVRGRRSFKKGEGGVVLDAVVFEPLFGRYVSSDLFDPADRTPQLDKVLDGAVANLPPERRAEMLLEMKQNVMTRAHAGVAAGSIAKVLRIFGG